MAVKILSLAIFTIHSANLSANGVQWQVLMKCNSRQCHKRTASYSILFDFTTQISSGFSGKTRYKNEAALICIRQCATTLFGTLTHSVWLDQKIRQTLQKTSRPKS